MSKAQNKKPELPKVKGIDKIRVLEVKQDIVRLKKNPVDQNKQVVIKRETKTLFKARDGSSKAAKKSYSQED